MYCKYFIFNLCNYVLLFTNPKFMCMGSIPVEKNIVYKMCRESWKLTLGFVIPLVISSRYAHLSTSYSCPVRRKSLKEEVGVFNTLFVLSFEFEFRALHH